MRILFVMDPIERINIRKDTTFAILLAAQEAGHELRYATMAGLSAHGRDLHIRSASVRVFDRLGDHAELGPWERGTAHDFDQIWMRKDPPFDGEYLAATWLLDLAESAGVRVLNRPGGLRTANEKAYILQFPEWTPKTMVSRDRAEIEAWCDEMGGRAVLKPLDLMGGAGIFLLHLDDPNLGSIIEQSTRYGQRYVMVQEFMPEAKEGDKRILLLDGEPLGAVLRVPQGKEFRGNLAAGGVAVASDVAPADRAIIDGLRPRLVADGLHFVGIDVIGGRLTEVNVTSPTGIQEMARFDGRPYAAEVVTWAERLGSLSPRGDEAPSR
jgi:glutathione synthase